MVKAAQSKPVEKKAIEVEQQLLKQLAQVLDKQDVKNAQELLSNAGIETVPLLCSKKFLVVANLTEQDFAEDAFVDNKHFQTLVATFGKDRVIPVCAKTEYELSILDDAQAQEMMEMLGMKTQGLKLIIKKAYDELAMITFFTMGPKEAHAWPIKNGVTIRAAAGEIHSDLQRGFICAEIFNYVDVKAAGSEAALKTSGKMRTEGQDYLVQDGDIINVKFNV
jgi:ribosome-binding ATPase YchF (GTP1/OBG family)